MLNVDVPTTGFDLIDLAAHEVYPGHHTEHAVKEQLLVKDRGSVEEAIQLVPTPQALLSEGIAEVGADVILDGDGRTAAYAVLAQHGIEFDRELTERIAKALVPLGSTSLDAALMIHEDAASVEEAQRLRRTLAPRDPRTGGTHGALCHGSDVAGVHDHLLGR